MAAVDRLVCDVFGFTDDGSWRMTGDFRTLLILGVSAEVRLSECTLMITGVEEEVVMGIEVGSVVRCGIDVEEDAWLAPVRCGGSSMIGDVRLEFTKLAWKRGRLDGILFNWKDGSATQSGVCRGVMGVRSFEGG